MSGSSVDVDAKFASVDAMLHPKTIAIVGAKEGDYAGRLLKNLMVTETPAKLFPINPNRESVFGMPCLHSISEIGQAVDLAMIVIPVRGVMEALHECVALGTKSAVVISAGFAELGTEEGKGRQAALRTLARESGMRVCGPNCIGLGNVADGIWPSAGLLLSADTIPSCSGIGLISQSGATCFGPLVATALDRRVGLHYIVSTGNEADLGSCDFAQYMLRDPGIKVLAMLVEGFHDGPKFVETAEMALEMGKPLVVLKVGRSAIGGTAARSHTAAMTGSDVVHDALFRQKGVVRVDDYDELIETANMFLKAKPPKGERVGIVSHSGGIASFLADKCGEAGVQLPPLSPEAKESLTAILGTRGSAANPLDGTSFVHNETFPSILEILLGEGSFDLQIVASRGGEFQTKSVIQASEELDKPFLYTWTGSFKDGGSLAKLQAADHVPVFFTPGRCAKAVKRLLDYYRTRRLTLQAKTASVPAMPARGALEGLRSLAAGAGGSALAEHDSKKVLSLFGIPTTREVLCTSAREATRAAAEIGYPVALKAASRQIAHKTEAGGVRLGIVNAEELAAAYERMSRDLQSGHPEAKIDGLLVQEMVPGGIETIVGVSRDPQFGPVLMLGLGGILVEALGAASWRVCPITAVDALAMIGEVKGLDRILAGYRGQPKADTEALIQALVRVSQLAVWGKDEIASLDINPLTVLAEGKGVMALDALVVPAS